MPSRGASLAAAREKRWLDQRIDTADYSDSSPHPSDAVGVIRHAAPRYRLVFEDHFTGAALDTNKWNLRDRSAAGSPTHSRLNALNGVHEFALDATSEAQTIGIDHGDSLQFDPSAQLVVEVAFTVNSDLVANHNIVIGMASANAAVLDDVATHAWFRLEGAVTDVEIESDDGTTDNDNKATGVTLTAGQMVYGRIVFQSRDNVLFYLGNSEAKVQRVAATTFKVGRGYLQPVAYANKTTGTSTAGRLRVDYFNIYAKLL